MGDHLITSMNDQQQDQDDQLSFCSDFEQLSHCSNIDGDGEGERASIASDGRTFSASELDNNAAQQQQNPSMMTAEQQQSLAGEDIGDEHSMAAQLHICEIELKLANAEKQKAKMKAEILLKKVEQLEADKIDGDERHKVLEGRVAQLVDAIEELRVERQERDSWLMDNVDQKLADAKDHTKKKIGKIKRKLDQKLVEVDVQMDKMATTPVNNELQVVKMRLELLEDEGRAKAVLMKLVEKDRLMEWLITGAGLLRNSLLRIAANQLVTWGGWKIHNGGLNATLIKADCFCANIRAAQPFPVVARPAKQLLYYFEVTVTGTSSSIFYIGHCGADFPFTSTTASVGAVAGSFAICKDGDYGASGQWHSGFGKGVLNNGDVVGCGLLVLPSAERHLFFTKSGEIWGKPILLGPSNAEACMYPIVSAYDPGTEVVFNFGADLVAKPFRYELAHLAVIDG